MRHKPLSAAGILGVPLILLISVMLRVALRVRVRFAAQLIIGLNGSGARGSADLAESSTDTILVRIMLCELDHLRIRLHVFFILCSLITKILHKKNLYYITLQNNVESR
jgi:hypothetical protein